MLQGDDRVFGITLPPQDYDVLRRKHLAKGTLFEDQYFPATDQSMFYSQKPPRKFEWKRPKVLLAHGNSLLIATLFVLVTL